MLDAGSGLFRSLPLIEHESLHILLSHAHLDHVWGLTFLWNVFFTTPAKEITVWGEEEKLQAIREHVFSSLVFPSEPNINWQPLPSGPTFEINGAKVTWFPLMHPGGSVGYRIDWQDSSLGYVTDTHATPDSDYWNIVSDVNLLLHECNFKGNLADFAAQTGHTDLSSLCDCLEKWQLARVVLTHMNTIDDDLSDALQKELQCRPRLRKLKCEIAFDNLEVVF